MTKKRIISVLLMAALLLSCFSFTAFAEEAENTNGTCIYSDETTDIYISNTSISDSTKERIISHFTTEDGAEPNDGISTQGLICSIFGHNLEYTYTVKMTHKVNAVAPRCLRRTYEYATCTRCDYENTTLTSTMYVNCCL